ncbi:chaperone NapD [Aminobacter sp. AP02]|uniref:chaperone NapD n=1 Tax=Aminobacter sp. AP02 TaxID=2135737 RepID=UPI000D6BA8B0|nr:chaperone NapD [Aminobacter sp. AP02]PWK73839.1 periplasmic nitrate reductase chaperone NapD [Aminobacter sp. AP02]
MPDARRYHHISSAVVTVMPGRMADVLAAIARLDGPEIRAHDGNRIVIVIEGTSAGELGGLLTAIGALSGVVAANMVFEHIEELEGSE